MAKRKKTHSPQSGGPKNNLFLIAGGAALALLMLGYGAFYFFAAGSNAAAPALANSTSLETVSLTAGQALEPVDAAPVTDRESRFLGPHSDPATAALAESGDLGRPTLVWFHADWCHICQQIKPEVIDLGEEFEGRVNIVRVDVDDPASDRAVITYGVRGTPTFVLFDSRGEVRGAVPGWPGRAALVGAFDQLLGEQG